MTTLCQKLQFSGKHGSTVFMGEVQPKCEVLNSISPGVIPNSVWLTLSPGTCPETRGSEPAPETSRNSWIGTCPGTFPEPVVRNVVRNLRNLSFRTCPGTRGSEPAPEPSWNPWFRTCPGTFPEPVVRNLPRNLPGTRDSEPPAEPSRNLSFGACPGT